MTKADVVQFAIKQGYDDAVHIGKWRDYDVYEPIFKGAETSCVGPPLIVLVQGENIRMATVEESYRQMDDA